MRSFLKALLLHVLAIILLFEGASAAPRPAEDLMTPEIANTKRVDVQVREDSVRNQINVYRYKTGPPAIAVRILEHECVTVTNRVGVSFAAIESIKGTQYRQYCKMYADKNCKVYKGEISEERTDCTWNTVNNDNCGWLSVRCTYECLTPECEITGSVRSDPFAMIACKKAKDEFRTGPHGGQCLYFDWPNVI